MPTVSEILEAWRVSMQLNFADRKVMWEQLYSIYPRLRPAITSGNVALASPLGFEGK